MRLFVWQPLPIYGYDLRHHLIAPDLRSIAPFAKTVEGLARARESRPEEFGDVLWLADLQQGRKENLYVDEVHYTARFSREIAVKVSERLVRP